MSGQKLLIVDNSEEFPLALSALLQNEYQIQCCFDGKQALSLLRSFQPDIMLLEIVIPGLDGISLLQAASEEDIHPIVITYTRFYNVYMMDALNRLKVSYWLIKPCDLQGTAQRIRDLSTLQKKGELPSPDPEAAAQKLLFSLGFVTKHHGYAYLLDAIVMASQKPDLTITKHIYPDIAYKYNCNQANVEHAIRTAVKRAWSKRDDTIWRKYFLPAPDGTISCPTNGTFISRISLEL